MRDTLKAFKCARCTDETGMMAHTLVQVLREPHEANGKIGGRVIVVGLRAGALSPR
jgi:hypothetical protein